MICEKAIRIESISQTTKTKTQQSNEIKKKTRTSRLTSESKYTFYNINVEYDTSMLAHVHQTTGKTTKDENPFRQELSVRICLTRINVTLENRSWSWTQYYYVVHRTKLSRENCFVICIYASLCYVCEYKKKSLLNSGERQKGHNWIIFSSLKWASSRVENRLFLVNAELKNVPPNKLVLLFCWWYTYRFLFNKRGIRNFIVFLIFTRLKSQFLQQYSIFHY